MIDARNKTGVFPLTMDRAVQVAQAFKFEVWAKTSWSCIHGKAVQWDVKFDNYVS